MEASDAIMEEPLASTRRHVPRCPRCGAREVMPSLQRRPGAVLRALGLHRWRCMSCLRAFVARPTPRTA